MFSCVRGAPATILREPEVREGLVFLLKDLVDRGPGRFVLLLFRVSFCWCRVPGFGVRVSDFGLRDSRFRFRGHNLYKTEIAIEAVVLEPLRIRSAPPNVTSSATFRHVISPAIFRIRSCVRGTFGENSNLKQTTP